MFIKAEDIRCRWTTYFEKLMNEESEWSRMLNDVHVHTGSVNGISIDEVRKFNEIFAILKFYNVLTTGISVCYLFFTYNIYIYT